MYFFFRILVIPSLVKLFNRTLPGNDFSNYRDLLEYAILKGYFVHESCNRQSVRDFLATKPSKTDFASTFYKKWEGSTHYSIRSNYLLFYWTESK